MDKQTFEILLEKYKDGSITEGERQQLYSWANDYVRNSDLPDISLEELERLEKKSRQDVYRKIRRARSSGIWYRAAAAAAIIVIGVVLYQNYQKPSPETIAVVPVDDVAPGGNNAFLISNGRKIALNDVQTGDTILGTTALKTGAGTIRFDQHAGDGDGEQMTTITTPKGGTYHIILPDGSAVWLNAASTLTMPISTFTSTPSRFVRLQGEAYFEIAKDPKRPFIVETAKQQVKVLGTHFNVQSYADEQAVNTTLLEGSVELISTSSSSQRTTLIPGQMAHFQDNHFSVEVANDNAIAWTKGKIKFENTNLDVLLRQLARWYDVKVKRQDTRNEQVTGVIDRTYSLKTVLEILNGMGISSRLERRNGTIFLVVY